MLRILPFCVLFIFSCSLTALERFPKQPFRGHQSFDVLKPDHFTQLPEKNTSMRNGVLWTHGESGKPDVASGSYRAAEKLMPDRVKDLNDDTWHQLELVFKNDSVVIRLDNNLYHKELTRPGFKYEKQEIAMFLKGGENGIEIDDLKVVSDYNNSHKK